MNPLTKYLAAIGRRGGKANTAAQNAARRENGKLGGRPKKQKRRKPNAGGQARESDERCPVPTGSQLNKGKL